jgi:hypothetical protein
MRPASSPPADPSGRIPLQPGAETADLRADRAQSRGDEPMATWTDDELSRIGDAGELEIAPLRDDGTLRPPTTIWVVRDGDGLYVRAFRGRTGAWFRATQVRHEGRITSAGVTKNVTFAEEPDPAVNDRLDAAYRTKYRSYDQRYVDPMVTRTARETTLRLVPR